MKDKQTLYLIDGSAIAYRSYFGMIRNRLTNSAGQPTGALTFRRFQQRPTPKANFSYTNLLKIFKVYGKGKEFCYQG